jgi:hypothetical protein
MKRQELEIELTAVGAPLVGLIRSIRSTAPVLPTITLLCGVTLGWLFL